MPDALSLAAAAAHPESQLLSNGASSPAAAAADAEEQGDATAADGSVAERLQAVEALYSLARSFGGGGDGGKGDARSAAIAAASGGGVEVQGKRLTRTAEFFLEVGFFAAADSGGEQ